MTAMVNGALKFYETIEFLLYLLSYRPLPSITSYLTCFIHFAIHLNHTLDQIWKIRACYSRLSVLICACGKIRLPTEFI